MQSDCHFLGLLVDIVGETPTVSIAGVLATCGVARTPAIEMLLRVCGTWAGEGC